MVKYLNQDIISTDDTDLILRVINNENESESLGTDFYDNNLKKVKTLFLIRVLIFILPSFFSDLVYDLVAKTRYMIFGRYDSCPVLEDNLNSRIIE